MTNAVILRSALVVGVMVSLMEIPMGAMSPEQIASSTRTALKSFSRGDLDAARSEFEKILDADPDNLTALVNLGALEYRLKDFDSAELHLNRAVRINADAGAAWVTLGVLYLEKERLDDALAALSRALVLDPGDWRVHNYLGVTIGRKGWLYGAEQELRKAIELNPEAAEPNFNLALIYMQRKPPPIELARRHYREAIRLGGTPDPLLEQKIRDSTPGP
jgi:Flp pilus assembly protein TadD